MAKNENRNFVTLRCTVCGEELRCTSKNKKNTEGKIEIKKHCPRCNQTTVHKERKAN